MTHDEAIQIAKQKSYTELSASEIQMLQQADPAYFTELTNAYDAQFAPTQPRAKRIFRNGFEVESGGGVAYKNGFRVEPGTVKR